MRKILLVSALVLTVSPLWAAQQAVTQISGTQGTIGALKTQTNSRLAAVQSNFSELYDLIDDAPFLAQETAPSIHNILWIDTSGESPVVKFWDGDSWEAATASSSGTYTLPVASASVLGGVKQGTGTSIAGDGAISVTASGIGLGTSDNPSFNSVHVSGGNLAAANKQVTKAWQTGLSYTASVTSVIHGDEHYIAKTTHTADSTTQPGVGANWEDAWKKVSGVGGGTDYLSLTNTTAFTPDADYEPATKKYVDDAITAGGGYTDEMAQDAVGGMFTGNTETGITVTYDDATGKVNFAVATQFDGTQSTTGTAAGLTSQYIDWAASSGGNSIANKPSIAGLATSGITGTLTLSKSGTTARTATFPDAAGTVALTSDIPAAVTDATITTTDVTTNNATTSKHGWVVKATAPASGLRNVVAIDNGETAYTNKALFDATSPSTQAFGDSAAVGSAMTAARRDHKHAMPEAPTTISGNAGTATALAANPTDCSAGQYATTIAANGNLTCAQVSYSQIGSTPTLGTAAALDHGTAIGNLVRLADDGGGNAALPFTIDLQHLTDTTNILSGKAAASCFASESAFNACFDLTWGGGSMTYPGAGIPVSSGSAWGTSIIPGTGVAAAMAAAVDGTGGLVTYDADLITAKGASAASNSTYFGKNSSGTVGFHSLPSGSGTVTVQSADPTSASAEGWYAATGSGDIFYKSSAGLFTIAGSYTADPVTRTLTVTSPSNGTITCSDSDLSAAINCGTGGSACSATTTDGATVSGITATADSGYEFDAWSGDLSGSTSPETLTMSVNRGIGATFEETITGEGATCSGYETCQNFETPSTGYDNSETWGTAVSGTGSVAPASTSSPLRGDQSMLMTAGTGLAQAQKYYAGSQTSGSRHFIFSTAGAPSTNGAVITSLRDTGGNDTISIQMNTSGYARIEHGGVQSSYGSTVLTGGTYHIWLDWTNGSGSNGTATMYVSNNGTKPGSAYASVTTGTGSVAKDRVMFFALAGQTNKFDFILEKTTTIGSVVE